MATYHQSDLNAWGRCPAQLGFRLAGMPNKTTSAAAYGSVMHHSVETLERELRSGVPFTQAVATACETFTHYWSAVNIEAICQPVPPDGWLPRQSASSLQARAMETIPQFAALIRDNGDELLATEYAFIVPIQNTWDEELGEPHQLAGAIDRLSIGLWLRYLVCQIGDYKTGAQPVELRQAIQFTAYCYASTQREFWVGARGEDGFGPDRGEELYRRLDGKGRRATWINLQKLKFNDAGWRGPTDYARLALAVTQMHASITADIFPLSISGANCRYCEYRSVCGGTGIATAEHGSPRAAEPADRPVALGMPSVAGRR